MGITLVSGFSPAIAKLVFSAKLDPYEALLETLGTPRYAKIGELVNDLM